MDALGLATSRSNITCSSVQDLQGHLHQLLATKTTETRAEHSSVTYELLSNTSFYLTGDPDNTAIDATDPAQSQQQQPITRTVLASETVQHQPTDDPVLQKAVAKHISSAIGAVDRSAWTVREVTRGAQGWQFTYICKDSLQAWNRANAKNPDRPVIGSYSKIGSQDPINLSRPAFDCRGSLTVAFSKSSRGVIVKYEHTPLHKTVTQLVEQLIPAPVPAFIGSHASQRTPRAKRPPVAEGEEGSRKKRAPRPNRPPPAGGENEDGSTPNKRTPRAKRPRVAEGENGEGSRKKRRKTANAPVANMEGGLTEGQNTFQNQPEPHSAVDKAGSTGFLNVPPAEAERRRETAVELLTGKGIDPKTLSVEQFNIFANQAPNLQAASLDMLAKYGAERLRIVHPDEKEQAGSSNSTPHKGDTDTASASPAAEPTPQSGTTATPSKKSRSRKKKPDGPLTEVSIGNGAVVPLEQDGGLGTTESALKPKNNRIKKTRGQCETCKQRQVKCTRQHPSCAVCIEAGLDCTYLPPKPRRKSEKIEKSAEIVEQNDSDVPETNDDVRHETENEAEYGGPTTVPNAPALPASVSQEPQEPQEPHPDMDNEEFIPDPNILSGPVEHHTAATHAVNDNDYFQHSHSGLSFPQMSAAQTAAGNNPMPGLTYPQTHINEETPRPASSLAYQSTTVQPQQPQQSHSLSTPQSISTSTNQQRQLVSSSGRKSLPTNQAKQTPVPVPSIPTHTSSWSSSPPINHAATVSPNMSQQQAAKRPKSRKPRAELDQQGHDALKQAPSQSTQYQSPMTRSPYQSAAHVHTRQSHSSQTSTPVVTTSRPPPKAPYDPYPRYNHHGNENYNDTGNEHSSSRIPYESTSYQIPTTAVTATAATTTTAPTSYSSTPSYDYGRASGASNPLAQALNSSTGYSGATGSTTNQWSTPQTRAGQTSNTSSAYSLPAASAPGSQSYSARTSDARSSNQNAPNVSTTPYNPPQSQTQSYGSYSSQQPNLNQQNQQTQQNQQNQQNQWYGFTTANNSTQPSYTNSRQSGYGSHRSNAPGYSNQYSGNDDQAIYDLLRTSGSNH